MRNSLSIWVKYVVLVAVFLGTAVLLRFVAITIYAAVLSFHATPQAEASRLASVLFLENQAASLFLGGIQGFIWFAVVFLIVRVLEKQPFRWEDFGLRWNRSAPGLFGLGALLGAAAFGLYLLAAWVYDTPTGLRPLPTGITALTTLYFLANGFGEEIAFRAYLQDRLSARFSPIVGVLLAAALFVPLHLLVRWLAPLEVFTGMALWIAIGLLYQRTRSLYLVGALHAALNTLPAVLGAWIPAKAMLPVHLAALAAALIAWRRMRAPFDPALTSGKAAETPQQGD